MFKNVLLAVDLNHDESWRKALPVAIGVCQQHGARLHAVSVIPDLHMPMIASHFPEGFLRKLIEATEHKLAAFVRDHVPDDVSCTDAVVSGGAIYELLLRYADEHAVDLIVMEAYHPDLKDFLLGSNAEKVARHAKQSVLVVRE
jgi:nucleotide-binding universal stress UspA family protein